MQIVFAEYPRHRLRRWLPSPELGTNIAFLVFLPRQITHVPAPIQHAVGILVQLYGYGALPKCREIVIAFLGSARKLGLRVVHGAALCGLKALQPCTQFIVFDFSVSDASVTPHLRIRAQHRAEVVPEIPTTHRRVTRHRVRGKVSPYRALKRETRSFVVEVVSDVLMQTIQRLLLAEQALEIGRA